MEYRFALGEGVPHLISITYHLISRPSPKP